MSSALRQYLLVALVLVALGSVVWSDYPGVSLRRAVALVLTCVFGVYLTSRFTLRQQLSLLSWVCGVSVLLSYPFGILGIGMPSEEFESAWYGIFIHKNDLGRMMVLSVAVFLLSAKIEPAKKTRMWIGALLAFILLLLSHSATSLVGLAATLAVFPFCHALSRNRSQVGRAVLYVLSVATIGIYWAIGHLQDILEFLGKDITLTGRLPLWILSGVMAIRRPWLGYGYNAFWAGPGSASEKIWSVIGWKPPHAHNGLLELWLELGILGVGLFVIGFFAYSVRAVRLLRISSEPEVMWPLLFLVLMAVTNLTEVTILSRNNLFWILYTTVAISVSPNCPQGEPLVSLPIPEGRLA